MSRITWITSPLIVAALSFGCALTTDGGRGRTPTVTSVSPASAPAGSGNVAILVSGSNFGPSTTVLINGSPHPTSGAGRNRLQSVLNSQDLAAPGVLQVSVTGPNKLPKDAGTTDAMSVAQVTSFVPFIVTSSSVQILTSSIPAAVAQSGYGVTLAVQGGTAPYAWSVVAGQPPPGITLSGSGGVLSGTPTQTGQFSFSVQATDSSATPQSSTQLLALNVSAAASPLSITFAAFPGGIAQNPYATVASATGGTTPYLWTIASGSLPPGLSLNSSTGAITGTPSTTSTYNFTVQVRDSSSTQQTASASSSILIVAPLQISTTSLPTPQVQTSYSATLTTSGGMPPFVWSVSAGTLPTGLTLNSSTGVVNGTPTTAGSYSFTVRVDDPPQIPQSASKAFTLNLPTPAAPLQITTTSLPAGQAQASYTATLTAVGGTTPYTWILASGSLPAGLSLNASTGVISGIPTTGGSFSFIVQVRDSATSQQVASQTLSITITNGASPLQINTTSLPDGQVQVAYQATLVASGGTAPYTWSVSSGTLPALLALLASTGQISGTPSTAGTFGFVVQVRDSAGQSSSTNLAINIATQPPLSITTASLPNGTVGASYSGTLQATGGTLPYAWSVLSGQLPGGLSLEATSGIVSGTPAGSGTFSFTVQVTDAKSQVASLAFSVNIAPAPSAQAPPLTYTSRTDVNAAPETVPTLCSPAPCTMLSSDLNPNVKYTRVTDSNTVGPNPGDWFTTNGSAEQMEWNSNSTLFYAGNAIHGVAHFFKFDPATQMSAKVTCSFVGTNCWNGLLTTISGGSDGPMSGVSPYVYYSLAGTVIQKMDFSAVISSGGSSADTVTTVANASTCSGVPTTANGNLLAMNNDDTRFLTAFGGGQDNWSTVYVYDSTQHCRWFNMANFTLGGDWGPSGAASYFDEVGNPISAEPCSQIHNVRMSRDGRWAVISTQCGGGSGDIDFWDIATGNIYRNRGAGDVAPYYGGGHKMTGFNNIHVNNGTSYSPARWFTKRTIPPTGTPTWLTTGSSAFDDSHISWNNQTSGQLQPFIVSAYQSSPPAQAWGDEIFGVVPDGSGTVYRFAHMYTRAHDFNAQGMANVSRDGKWAIFTSDWTTGRDDVFVVSLK